MNAQFGYNILQTNLVKKNFLYLDTCTTNNYMCNRSYLKNVHPADTTLRLHTNAGSTSSTRQGYLGSLLMWLGQSGFANVVALHSLEQLCRKDGGSLSYHSKHNEGAFIADMGNGRVVKFFRCPDTDFPCIDLDDHVENGAVMLLQSIASNMEGYTKTEVRRAIHARDAQAEMAYVSKGDLKTKVSGRILRSSNLTRADISNAKNIFGPTIYTIRGKQTTQKPSQVEPEYLSIPKSIVDRHKNLTLVGDVMSVCGLPFFLSLSRGIRFGMAQYRPRRTAKLLSNALKETIKLYKRAGFIVQTCLMDNEFESMKAELSDTCVINTTAKNEHVGEIERYICTIKGKSRCINAEF